MILTCPACASRYLVEAVELPTGGRQVRCAACGESWRAMPEAAMQDEAVAPGAAPVPETEAAAPFAKASRFGGEALPRAFRQKAEAKRRTRQAVAAGVVWAGLAAGCAVLILAAIVFRVQVVDLWPRTAGAYAAVRLPVNPLGLTPDGVQVSQGLQDGHVALIVTGAERNIDTGPRAPAPLRVSVYDKGGARLTTRIVRLTDEPIPAGASRSFSLSLIDPPMSGAQVGLEFVFVPPRPAAARQAAPPTAPEAAAKDANAPDSGAPHLRGLVDPIAPTRPRPVVARSIPAGSPYALTGPARAQSE